MNYLEKFILLLFLALCSHRTLAIILAIRSLFAAALNQPALDIWYQSHRFLIQDVLQWPNTLLQTILSGVKYYSVDLATSGCLCRRSRFSSLRISSVQHTSSILRYTHISNACSLPESVSVSVQLSAPYSSTLIIWLHNSFSYARKLFQPSLCKPWFLLLSQMFSTLIPKFLRNFGTAISTRYMDLISYSQLC